MRTFLSLKRCLQNFPWQSTTIPLHSSEERQRTEILPSWGERLISGHQRPSSNLPFKLIKLSLTNTDSSREKCWEHIYSIDIFVQIHSEANCLLTLLCSQHNTISMAKAHLACAECLFCMGAKGYSRGAA